MLWSFIDYSITVMELSLSLTRYRSSKNNCFLYPQFDVVKSLILLVLKTYLLKCFPYPPVLTLEKQHMAAQSSFAVTIPIRTERTAGDHAMDMDMLSQVLSPGVQHHGDADLAA